MSHLSQFRSILLAGAAMAVVAGCSDSNIASPGEGQLVPAPAPTPGGGGTGGGATMGDFTPAGGCPTGTTSTTIGTNTACAVATVGGAITANLTLTGGLNADGNPTVYTFNEPVFVGTDDGPTPGALGGSCVDMTVGAGAVLVFANSTDFLTVNRCSRLIANGQQAAPIIMTSDEDFANGIFGDEGDVRGQWGGLIINGRAPINNCADPSMPATCSATGEGGTGSYGGPDANDDSGTLNYIRVQYAGFEITTDNELNGIAFQGVGDTSNIDFFQVHNNDDDGVEFFGGTVNVRHVVLTGVDDDGLDWVAGWNGNAQDVVIVGSGVGDNGFEGDNNSSNNDVMPRSNPTISNWTAIGSGSEDLGMQIREGTAGTFINGIVTGWSDGCLDVDDAATFALIGGALTISNSFFSCGTGFVNDGAVEDSASAADDDAADAAAFPLNNTVFPGVTVGVSTLSGVLPGANEQGVASAAPQTVDASLADEQFLGAFAPNLTPSQTWAFGWTVAGSVFTPQGCPTGTTDVTATAPVTAPSGGNICRLPVNINADLDLVQGNIYEIAGPTFVGQDVGSDSSNPNPVSTTTLSIQAGVTVYGVNSTDFLTVNRGSKLVAAGTSGAPIIFTSDEDLTGANAGTERGQWGGLVINGRAPINNCANPASPASCSASGEGGTGSYGGDDATDSSGLLNYVRVQFAGFEITTDNELNGIAFQGVGNSTEVDYVQVHNNDDDGIEFFGGSVDATHLVVTGVDDDFIDWVAGWNGSIQYALIVGSGVGDNGFEGDNNSSNNNVSPRSNPIFSNWTAIGSGSEDLGMQIREGTAGVFINGVVDGWADGCLDVDDAATFGLIDSSAAIDNGDGDLQISATYFSCATSFVDDGAVEDSASAADDDAADAIAFPLDNTSFLGITTGASTLSGVNNGANEDAVTPIDPSTVDANLEAVTSIGANADASNADWFVGWTVSGSF